MRAFREPMVWLIVIIPILTVIGGVVTIRMAAANGPLASAPETVSRSGQMQQSDLGPDAAAMAQGLQATLVQRAPGRFEFTSWPTAASPAATLMIVHPNRQELDQRLSVTGADQVLEFAPDALPWELCEFRLQDQAGTWRLVGRLDSGSQEVHLQSKLSRQ